MPLISDNAPGSGHPSVVIVRLSGGHIEAVLNQDSSNGPTDADILSTDGGYNDGAFHQVTITRSGTLFSLYVNDIPEGSATTTGVVDLTNPNPLELGVENAADNPFSGTIDEIQVYDRALSQVALPTLFSGMGGNRVQGNKIGTDASGTSAIPGGVNGVNLSNAYDDLIGGPAAGAGNLISGNALGSGIALNSGVANRIQGNTIGTTAAGPGMTAAAQRGRGLDLGQRLRQHDRRHRRLGRRQPDLGQQRGRRLHRGQRARPTGPITSRGTGSGRSTSARRPSRRGFLASTSSTRPPR